VVTTGVLMKQQVIMLLFEADGQVLVLEPVSADSDVIVAEVPDQGVDCDRSQLLKLCLKCNC